MSQSPILVWFRNDLRLDDHPALSAAVATGRPVIPVFLHTPAADGVWPRGAASRWWLHHALQDFSAQLQARGSGLVLRSGTDPAELLKKLFAETGASAVYWNRRYDPSGTRVDTEIKSTFPAKSYPGSLLREPHEVKTLAGDFYKVFTPFYKSQLAMGPPPEPLDAPRGWLSPSVFPASESLASWNLLPRIPWDRGFYQSWDPTAAADQSETFLDEAVGNYKAERDFPAKPGTSRISPFLHFGQISPRRLWHDAMEGGSGSEAWLRQLVWRDFSAHLLFHQPRLDLEPLQPKFRNFPWKSDPVLFKAWCKGKTGYPIVDAGMRELWSTGWMHNRVRMIVASFLVKDLLIPWQDGARWFWGTLVDADLANNSFGWQWTAGCGADAAPYFRIFNPILQSKKFDPEGLYLRRWLPEIAHLATADLHAPWEARTPPPNYPKPIVDHSLARDQALEALSSLTI